ncbi:YncE family protein [Prescottella equi]
MGNLTFTPDGARAYALTSSSVSVIDTATNTVTATIPIDGAPSTLALTADGTRAYVTHLVSQGPHGAQGSAGVSVIDTATNSVIATVPIGKRPTSIAIAPDGARVYVTNQGDGFWLNPETNSPVCVNADGCNGMVSVIDTATNTVTATVPTDGRFIGVAITPDGTRAYLSHMDLFAGSPVVRVLDTATNALTTTIPIGPYPGNVAITPDGTRAYAASQSGSVSVIDTSTNAVTATVPVEKTPSDLAITPDGTRAYVTNWGGKSVSAIDTSTNTVTAITPLEGEPGGLAITPDGTRAYVPQSKWDGVNNTRSVAVIAIDRAPAVTGTPTAGVVGQPYSHAFTITGQPAPTVAVTAGSLPAGLTLTPEGVLAGTPTASGQFRFTITAANGTGHDAVLPVVLDITGSASPSTGSLGSLGS